MDEFKADLEVLDGVAQRLWTGSAGLEGGAAPPPAPEAGAVTGPIAATLSVLSQSLAGVVEGLAAAGDAVTETRGVYAEVDRQQSAAFGPGSP
jgi:hypothetical protein